MHTVWKSRGRVSEVFAKFWEGGYIGVVKFFLGGYTILVFYNFYCIFINKFSQIFEGGYTFIPPHPPLCASMVQPSTRSRMRSRSQNIISNKQFWTNQNSFEGLSIDELWKISNSLTSPNSRVAFNNIRDKTIIFR